MSKGATTRERILDRAVDLVAIVGFEGMSLGDLAKATKMSKSGLFAHFESKEDLLLGVLETAGAHFIDTVISPALREPRGEPRVRALLERWLAWVQARESGGCPFVAATSELDDCPGRLRDALVAVQLDWIETLATAARIAVEEGHFRPELDTRQLAYDIYGISLAFHFYHRLLRDPEASGRAADAFERLLEASR